MCILAELKTSDGVSCDYVTLLQVFHLLLLKSTVSTSTSSTLVIEVQQNFFYRNEQLQVFEGQASADHMMQSSALNLLVLCPIIHF